MAVTAKVLRCSKQALRKRLTSPVSRRDWDDAHPINAADDVQLRIPRWSTGSAPTNCAKGGLKVGEDRVARAACGQGA